MPDPTTSTGLPLRVAPGLLILMLAASPWDFSTGSDGVAMLATAESVRYRGSLAVDDRFLEDDDVAPSAMRGVDGRAYAKYGLGLPLVEVPVLAAADAVSWAGGLPHSAVRSALLSLLNPVFGTLTCLLAGALAGELGAGRGAARGIALATGASTLLLFHATTDGSDTLLALLSTAATYALARHGATRRPSAAWMCGGFLGYAVLTKPVILVAVPVFAAAAALSRVVASGRGLTTWRIPLREWLTPSVTGTWVPALLASVATLWLNIARFGSPWQGGYNDPVMTADPWPALLGLTVGFNRGLLWYAPPAALGLTLVPRLARSNAPVALAILGVTAALLATTARFYEWGGGWTWGPRYLLPVVPMLVAACAGAPRWAWRAACAAGLVVSLLGVVISDDAYRRTTVQVWLPEATGTVRAGTTRSPGTTVELAVAPEDVLPSFSAIAGHFWLARVAASPCDCSRVEWWCACRAGGLEEDATFMAPPWRSRFPGIRPAVPYGVSFLRPAALRFLYRRFVFAPEAFPPGDRR